VDFKTADGFMVCSDCGATYAGVLSVCPGCKKDTSEMETPLSLRRYLCNIGYLCQLGGPDGVCCISCLGYHSCLQPCNTAQNWMKNRDELKEPIRDDLPFLFGKELCERLTKEWS